MKLSLFRDDKSTHKDEIVLSVILIACLAAGILLMVFKPSFWIVSGVTTAEVGVVLILFAVMFIPSVIYRFLPDKQKTK